MVSGYPAAGLPYFSVCAKSPLTNAIGEARAEGTWGIALKRSGFDAIAIRGRPSGPCGLLIEDGRPRIFDASEAWGMTVGEATDWAEARFGADAAVATIGPAGERRVRYASVVSSRCHQARRMGMGAVMGSKNLKMVVIRGGSLPPLADPAALDAITAAYARLDRGQRPDPLPEGASRLDGLDPPAGRCIPRCRELPGSLRSITSMPIGAEEFGKHYKGTSACPGMSQ